MGTVTVSVVVHRDVRFWTRVAPIRTNLTFKISSVKHKCTEKCIIPDLSHWMPIWPNLKPILAPQSDGFNGFSPARRLAQCCHTAITCHLLNTPEMTSHRPPGCHSEEVRSFEVLKFFYCWVFYCLKFKDTVGLFCLWFFVLSLNLRFVRISEEKIDNVFLIKTVTVRYVK